MHPADLTHDRPSLREKLEYIYGLRTASKINWDSAQYLALLEALGNPHLRLPPVIHVAGTNGKGSVVAMLRSIYEAAGYRVHTYTSPHLIRMNERICLGGQDISDDLLEGLIDEVLGIIADAPLSLFEITTAIAFKAFAAQEADILLLEVGMGGRLDCTNVVPAPLVSVINRISMDHTQFLGDTLQDIAAQKAGVMRAGVPCVVGFQGEDEAKKSVIFDVIKSTAHEVCSDLYIHGEDWDVTPFGEEIEFCFCGGAVLRLPLPHLAGAHQIMNAGLALSAIFCAQHKFPVAQDAMAKGLQNVVWRGRMQRLDVRSISGLREGIEVWLDSGHNDSAGEVLAVHVQHWVSEAPDIPVYLVFGMLATKDVRAFLAPLHGLVKGIFLVPLEAGGAESLQENLRCHPEISSKLSVDDDVFTALHSISAREPRVRILVAGSVYLAGEVLRRI